MAKLKNSVTLEEKKHLVELSRKGITLDGEPAKIVGVKNKFPTIATVREGGPSFEWSWKAIREVMYNRGGKFES